MDHVITFKVQTTDTGPNKGKTRHYADCSCTWGTPLEAKQEDLYRIILVHLAGVRVINGLENMP
jgi:hypothetical protein